jgi:hypothetical protein
MDPVELALNGVLPPVVVALLLLLIGGGRWLGPAVALGTLFAYVRLAAQEEFAKWPAVPPRNGQEGLVVAVCLAGAIALVPERVPRPLRIGLGLVACAAAAGLLLWRSSWPLAGKLAVVPFLALLWWVAAATARRHPARPTCAAWCASFAAAAIVLLAARSQFVAQMAGAGAAALGTAAFVAIFRRFRVDSLACLPIAIAYGGWLTAGQAFTEPEPLPMLCAVLAPAGMLIGSSGPDGRRPWLAYGTTALLALAAAGLALPTVLKTDY